MMSDFFTDLAEWHERTAEVERDPEWRAFHLRTVAQLRRQWTLAEPVKHASKELLKRVDVAEAQNVVLRTWVNDLQSGMYVNCVYCGYRYGPNGDVPVTMAHVLKEHIEQCPSHPMSTLKATALAAEALAEKLAAVLAKIPEDIIAVYAGLELPE